VHPTVDLERRERRAVGGQRPLGVDVVADLDVADRGRAAVPPDGRVAGDTEPAGRAVTAGDRQAVAADGRDLAVGAD